MQQRNHSLLGIQSISITGEWVTKSKMWQPFDEKMVIWITKVSWVERSQIHGKNHSFQDMQNIFLNGKSSIESEKMVAIWWQTCFVCKTFKD